MKKALLALLTIVMFFPVTTLGQTDALDLTAIFVAGGITIDRLLVVQINDIVLIRGRTSDSAMAAEAGRFAVRRGYSRVANLIEIVPAIGDPGIETLARRRLEMALELAGCTFQIDSRAGILRLSGQVTHEIQKDFAIQMMARIDGVREVQSLLTMRITKSRSGVLE